MTGQINRAFLAKAIDRAQRMTMSDPFCLALHEYIVGATEFGWDDDRALFWVKHPQLGWQVAVWCMPVAAQFEPSA